MLDKNWLSSYNVLRDMLDMKFKQTWVQEKPWFKPLSHTFRSYLSTQNPCNHNISKFQVYTAFLKSEMVI